MRFELIDRVTAVEPGQSLQAIKALRLAEEYLQDHFPGHPVLPGVLMVEAMVQASAWLIRLETDFTCSMVLLKEVRNVRYGQFVRPGDQMFIEVDLQKMGDGRALLKGRGRVDGQMVVSARLELEYFNLADRDPGMSDIDDSLRAEMRRRWMQVCAARSQAPVKT